MQPSKLIESRNILNVFREIETKLGKDTTFLALQLHGSRDTTKTLVCHVIFELTLSKILTKPELCDDILKRDISKLLLDFVLGDLGAFEKPDIDIDTSRLLARRTRQEVSSLDELTLGHLRGLLAPHRDAPPVSLVELSKVVEIVISHVEKTEKLINSTVEEDPPQRSLC
jgi:hypothetical protein